MKSAPIWALVLLALLLSACAGGAATREAGTNDAEVVTAFVGDLAASATASGKVLPRRTAALSAATPARVEELFVRVGDEVEAGAPLLQLETADLELSLASARQELAVQEANLLDLQTPASEEDLAAAEAAVANAQAQLDELMAGPRPEEIASAEANVRAAEAGVWSSSAQLNQTRDSVAEAEVASARADLAAAELDLLRAQQANEANPTGETDQAMRDAQEAVTIAQAQLDSLLAGPNPDAVGAAQADVGAAAAQRDARQADLDLLRRGPSESRIAQAQANLAQAEASLSSLQDGPTAEDVRIAEAQVEQARLSVADAEEALADAAIRAPFPGVVTALTVSEGEVASGTVAEIMDADSLRVVLTVDEADIGNLEVGQPATITLEAWPDTELDSQVSRIAPAADNAESALVSYEVFLELGDTDLPVRAGMTANARLLTAQREGVLLVPNRAIIADRQSGAYYVDLLLPGSAEEAETVERVEVSIGLRDDDNTQITAGLEAGDRLRVGGALPNTPFGPGSGPPEGQGPFGD